MKCAVAIAKGMQSRNAFSYHKHGFSVGDGYLSDALNRLLVYRISMRANYFGLFLIFILQLLV